MQIMMIDSTQPKFVNVPCVKMCLVYLGTGFITDGSLHSAVFESLGQNPKDCIANVCGIQSINIITAKITLESLNKRNSIIMNDISVVISIVSAHNQKTLFKCRIRLRSNSAYWR
jgi:hypothetical protein